MRDKMMMRWLALGAQFIVLTICCLTLAAGCTGQTKRVDVDSGDPDELGTGLNSQDFRSVCERMARSLVRLPQIQNASTPPKVAVLDVTNNSNDLIDAREFALKIRTLLIKNAEGKIIFLDRDITEEVKEENREKERGKITGTGLKDRYGADFFLTGQIGSIDRAAGRGNTTYYRLSFRLTDAATQAIAWEDEYEIKKISTIGDVYR